jgi:hypothetical protein
MIIMISGRAGEGKTSFANLCVEFLQKRGYKAKVFPFAAGVKETAKSMGWDGEKDSDGRKLLQGVGNTGREYRKNVWANWNIREITDWLLDIDGEDWVAFIDDWRFPNEGNVLSESFHPVKKVRVVRPERFHALNGTDLYQDISETSLPEADKDPSFYDTIIYNSTSLEELENTAKQYVQRVIIGEK